jgi:hypothetical protein
MGAPESNQTVASTSSMSVSRQRSLGFLPRRDRIHRRIRGSLASLRGPRTLLLSEGREVVLIVVNVLHILSEEDAACSRRHFRIKGCELVLLVLRDSPKIICTVAGLRHAVGPLDGILPQVRLRFYRDHLEPLVVAREPQRSESSATGPIGEDLILASTDGVHY